MNEFLNYIKAYIETKFNSDTSITKTVTVTNAYKAGNEITVSNVPQIQIQIMDNSELVSGTSFEGEHLSSIPLQITSYTAQMKIDNVMKSAQESSIIFGQKIKDMFDKNLVVASNDNIKMVRRMTMSPALPLLEGKVYQTATRFEFWVANPYVVGTQPQNDEQGE